MRSSEPPPDTHEQDTETLRRFFKHLEAELKKIEPLATTLRQPHWVLLPLTSAEIRLQMIHVGIILILNVLAHHRLFLNHGLKIRVHDWMHEEQIISAKTVKQAQTMLGLLRRLLYPEVYTHAKPPLLLRLRVSADTESLTSSDEYTVAAVVDEDEFDSDAKELADLLQEVETDDEVVTSYPQIN